MSAPVAAEDWRRFGLCGPHNADKFTHSGRELSAENLEALALCGLCPVRDNCETDVLATHPGLRRQIIAAGLVFTEAGHVREQLVAAANPCAHCGQEFMTRHRMNRYCKDDCRRAAAAERVRAWRRANWGAA